MNWPAQTEAALRQAFSGSEFSAGELPGLDADEQLVVARRLLREGLVVPVAGPRRPTRRARCRRRERSGRALRGAGRAARRSHARHRFSRLPAAAGRATGAVGAGRAAGLAVRPRCGAPVDRPAGSGAGPGHHHPPTGPHASPAADGGGPSVIAGRAGNGWCGGVSTGTRSCSSWMRPPYWPRRRPIRTPVVDDRSMPNRSTPSARTVATTPAARSGAGRSPPPSAGSGPIRCGSAAMSGETGSRPMCWCCRSACCTAGSSNHSPGRWSRSPKRGGVLEQNLRGRVGFPPETQAAMSLVHRELPGLGVGDVRGSRQQPPVRRAHRGSADGAGGAGRGAGAGRAVVDANG